MASDYSPTHTIRNEHNFQLQQGYVAYDLELYVQDVSHKNAAKEMVVFFNGVILNEHEPQTIKTRTKLRQYTKRRILEMVSIYFGTVGTGLPLLVHTTNGTLELIWASGFEWQFVLALLPTLLYFIVGLRNLDKRYNSTD